MQRIFKISILISSIILLLIISNLALAQQEGEGYFLEKGNEFFVFDNLYINGYLSVGREMLDKTGEFGDVLVSDRVFLDETSSFIFCKDIRQSGTNAVLNRDCAEKVLVWHSRPDKGLEVVDPGFYHLSTNNIEAWPGTIIFQPNTGNDVFTDVPVKLIGTQGCFANRGSDCNQNELKTTKLYLQGISLLGDNQQIIMDSAHVDLGKVDLGKQSEYIRHEICWLAADKNSCPKGYAHPAYTEIGSGVYIIRGLDRDIGPVLCCNLWIDF